MKDNFKAEDAAYRFGHQITGRDAEGQGNEPTEQPQNQALADE